MHMLFQADLGKQTPEQVRDTFWKTNDQVEPDVRGFAEDLFRVAIEHQEKIDELISANSKHWRLERMARVDRNILRLATYELRYLESVPEQVTINEAIELAKEFGTEESSAFVNGVLDRLAQGSGR